MQTYITSTSIYNKSIKIISDCNTINFINLGTNVCTVDGLPLQQYQSLEIAGNFGEVNTKQYQLIFNGAGSNQLAVVRKIYTNEQQ